MTENASEVLKLLQREIERYKDKYWELTPAFNLLEFKEMEFNEELAVMKKETGALIPPFTDGEYIYYDPDHINHFLYENDGEEELEGQILHMVFHLMMADPVNYNRTDAQDLFSRYADLRTELLVHAMQGKRPGPDKKDLLDYMSGRKRIPETFNSLRQSREECNEILSLEGLDRDCHDMWILPEIRKAIIEAWENVRKEIFGSNTDSFSKLKAKCEESAEDGGRKEKENEDPRSKEYGHTGGSKELSNRRAPENNLSYKDILRGLFRCNEISKEDPESIDRMMYAYGMDIYDDALLIEPDPEPERKHHLQNLAIAIDTSGSCCGETTAVFLRELANIIRDIGEEGAEGRVIIYQCDSQIQNIKVVEDLKLLPEETENLEIYGGGGTDFRPVFEALGKEIKEGREVTGLLYLTDGDGDYPDTGPDYPVYFLMERCTYEEAECIPDWIRTVDIGEKEYAGIHD